MDTQDYCTNECKQSMKKLFIALLLLVVLLVGILVVKTFTYPFAKPIEVLTKTQELPIDVDAVKRFAGGIQIPTVSTGELGDFDYSTFETFKMYLKEHYPLVFEKAEYYEVNTYGMVFRLKGSEPSLLPILFLSHQDVVPPGDASVKNASPNTIFQPSDTPIPPIDKVSKEWDYPAFSGAVANGRIYGRGTLDMKGMLFALMESFTKMIEKEIVPKRDIYLAFGFDEEVGGRKGAVNIAQDFKNKGLVFDAVYDEGGVVLEKGSVEGIDSEVALIGCAEKGFLSAKITVKGLGGHSSMPPLESAIGKAAIIMQRLEKEQIKPIMTPVMEAFFKNVGGSMPFVNRMAIANQWLLQPLLLKQLEKSNTTNALIRTTTALTMMKGSDGTNVLSPEVSFVVNFRLLPGNSVKDVKDHLAKATKGFDVKIDEIDFTRGASDVSPMDSKAYQMIVKGIEEVYPNAIVTPYLTVGGTDAYKYQIVSKNIYRFIPFKINNNEQQGIHSTNEYISIANYMRMMRYFDYIMLNYDK